MVRTMRVSIYNLHNMCENNTLFLSRAWRYFLLNGHTVSGTADADLIFIGGCAVTDIMRLRCEGTVLKSIQRLSHAHFVVFGCLAAFPEGLKSVVGRNDGRLHIIPYQESHKLDELIGARIPFDMVSVKRLKGHVPYQPSTVPILSSYGCPFHCTFCVEKVLHPVYEEIPVADVVYMVEGALRLEPQVIIFLDDNFLLNLRRVIEVLICAGKGALISVGHARAEPTWFWAWAMKHWLS